MKAIPLRLLLGVEQACGYLPNRTARSAFVAPHTHISPGLYGELVAHGFRRSGDYAYRPACQGCAACIPVRLPAARFSPNRSQRRALAANPDLQLRIEPTMGAAHFALYQRYLASRHPFGGMDASDQNSFHEFLGSRWGVTEFWCYYLAEELVMVAVVDQVQNGLSAVYTFFNPSLARRSLGTYSVIRQIHETTRRGLDYLYLGYWVAHSATMAYKRNFSPLEQFDGHFWAPLSPQDPADAQGLPDAQHSPIIRGS